MLDFHRADLRWLKVDDRPWTDRDARRYAEGGYNAVVMYFDRKTSKGISLDFAKDLPNLAGLDVWGPLRDDTPAFVVPGLVHLSLITKSKMPLDLSTLPGLEYLILDNRDGIDQIQAVAEAALSGHRLVARDQSGHRPGAAKGCAGYGLKARSRTSS